MISRASGLPRRPPIAPHPASSLARHQDRQVVVHQLRDLVPGQPAPAHLNRVAPPDQVRATCHNRASRDLSNTHLVEAKMMFLDCPAYLDPGGAVRCGLPAEITCRLTMRSTDGPPESVMIRCPAGRWFNGPTNCSPGKTRTSTIRALPEPLPAPGVTARGAVTTAVTAGGRFTQPDSSQRAGNFPAQRAPAYYLGRPARLWITDMRPRRDRITPDHRTRAVTGGGKPPASRPGAPLTAGVQRTGHRGPRADRQAARDERDVRSVRTRDQRGVQSRPGWRALPVRALREPAMAGAVRSGLDLLASWRACDRAASQCRTGLRPSRRCRVAVGTGVVVAPDDRSADHAAPP